MTAPTLPNRAQAEKELILQHLKWRSEFESHLGFLAQMCDPEIINTIVLWTHSADDLDADYKAAKIVYLSRGFGNSQTVNTNCDSPLEIVRDIWRRME